MTDLPELRLPRSHVEWAPVLGGAAITTAIGLVLLTFGAALGLGITSAIDRGGPSPVAYAIAAGLYLLWVQLMAFFAGGYVAARLRGRDPLASEHETDVRDGLHGLITWGVGVIAAALIAMIGVTGGPVAARAANGQIAADVSRVVTQEVGQAAAEERAEAPVPASEAEARAEVARKLSVLSAFIAAASLLAGAVAAFVGAHAGGHHRDKDVVVRLFVAERPGGRTAPPL